MTRTWTCLLLPLLAGFLVADEPPPPLRAAEPSLGVQATGGAPPPGTVRGEVAVPTGSEGPLELVATAEARSSAPGGSLVQPAKVNVICPVDEKGRFECRLPAGRLDLRFKADGFAGEYVWDLELAEGATAELGRRLLVPGGSVVGRVETVDGSTLGEDVRVVLSPPGAFSDRPERAETLRADRLEIKPDVHGFFHVKGLPAGLRVLTVEDRDKSGSERLEVEVLAGLEAKLLEPLLLAPRATFELVVDPPRDPYLRPWRVELVHREGNRGSITREGEADENGLFAATKVPSGPYLLRVTNHRGDAWHLEEVEVSQEHGPFFVELPVVRIRGSLRLGGQPVSGHVFFGGEHGDPRAHHFADSSGAFEGFLPRAGDWPVSVELLEMPGAGFDAEAAWVPPPSPGEVAEVAIDLPATELVGTVRDGEGRPVPGAEVWASPVGSRSAGWTTLADEAGAFRWQGIPAGRYLLSAQAESRLSSAIEVEIEDRDPGARVDLTLFASSLRAQVVGPFGPLPGTCVLAFPETADGAPVPTRSADHWTGIDGRLEIPLPAAASRVVVFVFPPGHVARVVSLDLPQAGEVILAVGDEGGTLRLELGSENAARLEGSAWLVWHGVQVPLHVLRHYWANLLGTGGGAAGSLLLPRFETGDYSLCRSGEKGPHCVSGTLLPGLEATLTLDPS